MPTLTAHRGQDVQKAPIKKEQTSGKEEMKESGRQRGETRRDKANKERQLL